MYFKPKIGVTLKVFKNNACLIQIFRNGECIKKIKLQLEDDEVKQLNGEIDDIQKIIESRLLHASSTDTS